MCVEGQAKYFGHKTKELVANEKKKVKERDLFVKPSLDFKNIHSKGLASSNVTWVPSRNEEASTRLEDHCCSGVCNGACESMADMFKSDILRVAAHICVRLYQSHSRTPTGPCPDFRR